MAHFWTATDGLHQPSQRYSFAPPLTEKTGKARTVRTGALDTEGCDISDTGSPAFEANIPVGSSLDPTFTKADSEPVDGHGNVFVLVGIDANNYAQNVEMCGVGHSYLLVQQ